MNTLPIAQKIQAKYLRAVNNEMIGNYQHSIVVHIMRRIVKLIFETPDFAIDLPIESRWRDYYTTALQISAYLSYVQYEIIADDTIAHITLTDRYRAQILAAATPAESSESPAAPAVTTLAPSASAPASTPAECSECSECSAPTRVAANFRLKAVTTASLEGSLCISRGQGRRGRPQPSVSHQQRIKSERRHLAPQKPSQSPINHQFTPSTTLPPPAPTESATDNAALSECSECSAPAVAAANFRLKAVTTASLEGSPCNSRGQGRRGRPQPSDSHHQLIKSERRRCHLAPQKPRPSPLSLTPPHPPRPPTSRVSAALS